MKCGLLGRKLGHSYSPQIHACLGDYSYTLFEKEPEEVADFLKNGDFIGLNVTIPYKKAVIPYLAELSPNAKKLGAVNTIVRRSDGTLFGHNTDYFGFASLLKRSGLSVAGKKVLVLGSGGASNTVTAVLAELGAETVVISRSGENNYGNLQRHEDAATIVNATPVGMYPNTGVSPVDLKRFPMLEGVLDVIYNPARTQLLLGAEAMTKLHDSRVAVFGVGGVGGYTVEALARSGALIVSGLADGLDSAGHRAAVKNGCPTIGILGVPIDRTYPAANVALRHTIEQNGCILSEYAPGESTPGPVGFLQRNRLIAALSSALLVVEAREKSGTMSTVSHAERYGKPVFAVPGSIYSPDSAGTNRLLHEGRARAACSGADLVQALGLQASAAPEAETRQPDPMSDTERRVLACVGPQPLGVEELCVRSGLPTASLLSTLMKLQLTGRVTCLPGKRYVLR